MKALLWIVFVLAAFAGCQKEEPRPSGKVVISTQTDMSVPDALDELRLQVKVGGVLRHDRTFELAPDGDTRVPLVITLEAQEEPDGALDIAVVGLLDGEPRVHARAITTFPHARTSLIELPLQWLCLGSAKSEGDTITSTCEPSGGEQRACVAGECRPVNVPEATLPDYDPKHVFGGASGPGAGGACFGTSRCFAPANVVQPNSSCEVELFLSDEGEPNFALRLSDDARDDGICSEVGCLVPLDESEAFGFVLRTEHGGADASPSALMPDAMPISDAAFGDAGAGNEFTQQGARRVVAALPKAVCERLDDGLVDAILSSTSCETKTPRVPTCGPWSATDEERDPIEVVIYSNQPADAGAADDDAATDATVAEIELQIVAPPGANNTEPGEVIELTIEGADPEEVTWHSSDNDVATVDQFGVVTIVGPGTTTITASVGETSVSFEITATEPSVIEIPLIASLVRLAVSPDMATIPAGASVALHAFGTMDDGRTVDVSSEVRWSSSDASVAEVVDGVVFGLAAGEAVITVLANDLEASALVRVSEVELESLRLTPQSAVVAAGVSLKLTAMGTYQDGQTLDLTNAVNWRSDDEAIAAVDGAGLVFGVSAGQVRIIAELGEHSASAEIVVSDAQLTDLVVTPATANLRVGQSVSLSASATYSDGTSVDVSNQAVWTSVNPQVAYFVRSALLRGTAAGETLVHVEFGGMASEVAVTVAEQQVLRLMLSPSELSLPVGAVRRFAASATYANGESSDVTSDVQWSTDDSRVARIDEAGRITAHEVGETLVTATLGDAVATARVAVSDAVLLELQVEPVEVTLTVGTRRQLRATGSYSDGTSFDVTERVTWRSNSTGVATVDAQGIVDAAAVGQATISAALGGVTAQAVVTVSEHTLVELVVAAEEELVPVGEVTSVTAHAVYSDGSELLVTRDAQWSSSEPDVATVGSNGVVQARALGQTTVRASYGQLQAEVVIEVTDAQLVELVISPEWVELEANTQTTLMLQGHYTDGSLRDVRTRADWSSGNSEIASVSAGVVTAYAPGEATLTATLGELSAQALVVVSEVETVITGLTISAESLTVAVGERTPFSAAVTYSDGTIVDVTGDASWSTDAPDVASVALGVALGVAPGSATITAGYAGFTDSTELAVTPARLTRLVVTPAAFSLVLGSERTLTATATYSDDASADVSADVQWSSSDESVIGVTTSGLVVASAVGAADVTASLDGVSASARGTVTAPPRQLILTPSSVRLSVGERLQLSLVAYDPVTETREDVTAEAAWRVVDGNSVSVQAGLVVGIAEGASGVSASFEGLTANAAVTVTEREVSDLSLTPAALTLRVGETAAFQLVASYTDGTQADVTTLAEWQASSDVFEVNSGRVRGLGEGNGSVVANFGGRETKASVTVVELELEALRVQPDSASIEVGVPFNFSAIGILVDGSTVNLSRAVKWSIDDPERFMVSEAGQVVAQQAGGTVVTATYGQFLASAKLEARTAGDVARLIVSPSNLVLAPGEAVAISVLFDDGKQRTDVTSQVEAVTRDVKVASVRASSTELFVVGVNSGSTQLMVSYEGLQVQTSVSVTALSPGRL